MLIHRLFPAGFRPLVCSLVAVIVLLLGSQTVSADCTPGNRVDKVAFFTEVARQLRNPSVPDHAIDFAVRAFLAWEPYENTVACWNPLATTLRYGDSTCRSWDLPGNSAGVQQYPSQECGVRATAETLNYTFNGNGVAYQAIRRMMAKQGFDETTLIQELRRWVGSEGYARTVVGRWRDLYYESGSAPPGYTFCAWEDERCNFSGTADVAYGANGQFAYRQGVSGGVDCNNGVFGDPIFGVRKACYVRAIAAPRCTPNADQAALFVDAGFAGQCVVKGYGEYRNPGAIGLPNDSLSSLAVGGNVQVVLCEHDDYGGACEVFTAADDNLSDNRIGNDRVSSLRVERRGNAPSPAQCPGQYRAEYFANRSLSGSPVLIRCEGWPIRHDWSGGSPGGGVPDDGFSARWTGRARIEAGAYTFIARADDGIRVWLDSALILDGWRDQPPTEYRVTRDVSAGEHDIRVEYYENGGGALAEFRWERAGRAPVSCADPTEPNNASNQGREIQPNQTVQGFICPADDVDWFKISVILGDTIRLRLTSLPGDYDMVLYLDDREVARSEQSETQDEEIVWRARGLSHFGATAYLKVYGYGGAQSASDPYDLRLEKTWGGEVPKLPDSNCDGGEGVYLYEHSYHQGLCHKFTSDSPNPRDWSIGNDAASSIRIVGSWAATLYEHDDYQGASSTYTGDDGWLGDDAIGNDRVSSIRVQRRSVSSPAGGNIAPQARRSPDSIGSGDAFDGNLSTFWAAGHRFAVTLSWPEAVAVQRILVWDRPQNSPDNNQINQLIIRLSNGLEGRFDMESGGRRCVDVRLAAPQTVQSVTLIADDASGGNGLSEVEVWAGPKTGGPECSNSKWMP